MLTNWPVNNYSKDMITFVQHKPCPNDQQNVVTRNMNNLPLTESQVRQWENWRRENNWLNGCGFCEVWLCRTLNDCCRYTLNKRSQGCCLYVCFCSKCNHIAPQNNINNVLKTCALLFIWNLKTKTRLVSALPNPH